jgi:hypothetical protein
MIEPNFVRVTDFELDELIRLETVAETTGASVSLVTRLVRAGLLEAVSQTEGDPVLLPRRAVIRLRKMQRLRRDLGVNFAGASIILDLVERVESLNRTLAEMRRLLGEK